MYPLLDLNFMNLEVLLLRLLFNLIENKFNFELYIILKLALFLRWQQTLQSLSNSELQSFWNIAHLNNLVLLSCELIVKFISIIHRLKSIMSITASALSLFSSLLSSCIK